MENKNTNNINGMIILDKGKGMTSNACLSVLKRLLNEKKIGHTGTLDPNATGVLVCLIGNATKSQEYLMKYGNKIYEAELIIGINTDTQDITGKVLCIKDDYDKIEVIKNINDVLKSFIGLNLQTPPMYSAKKINGKKLVDIARKGQVVERKPSSIYIDNIVLLDNKEYDYDYDDKVYKFLLLNIKVECSKGTYIRTLCKDIGDKLNLPSCMGNLRRVKSGFFDIKDAITLDGIKNKIEISDYSFIKPCLYKENDAVVTFGKFETLHLGHKLLVDNVVSYAKKLNIESTLLNIGEITDNKILKASQKITKIKYWGIDNIMSFPFNDITKKMSGECFVEEILINQLKAKMIIVGSDCTFGSGGKGNTELLINICKKYNVDVLIIDKLKYETTDIDISSTLVKQEYEKGNIEKVNKMLGIYEVKQNE